MLIVSNTKSLIRGIEKVRATGAESFGTSSSTTILEHFLFTLKIRLRQRFDPQFLFEPSVI